MKIELPQSVVDDLIRLAAKSAKSEDEEFEVHAWSGGNVDDAYDLGFHDGEIVLAQVIEPYLRKVER